MHSFLFDSFGKCREIIAYNLGDQAYQSMDPLSRYSHPLIEIVMFVCGGGVRAPMHVFIEVRR